MAQPSSGAHPKLRKGGAQKAGAPPAGEGAFLYATGKDYSCQFCKKKWAGKSGLWAHRNHSPCADLKVHLDSQAVSGDGAAKKKQKREHTYVVLGWGLGVGVCVTGWWV